MHLDPEDLVRPHRPAGGAPSALTAPTEPHPRVPRSRRCPDDAQTRLSLADLAPPAPTAVTPASVVGAVLDAHGRRMDAIIRRGPGGVFGWRPSARPSLAEVAAARQKVAEEEERRKLDHLRHMDVLEAVRAYLGIIALVLLVLFVGAAALLALGILSGYYTWAPVHH